MFVELSAEKKINMMTMTMMMKMVKYEMVI